MRIHYANLSQYTTLKIGGKADVLSVPENLEELVKEINYCQQNKLTYRILGNGSNLLVYDSGVRGFVINLSKCCTHLELTKDNLVKVGAGVNLHDFIRFSIKNNLYGNEYLSSVPGTIGGAIFMNAGTWTDKNLYISDYLVSVTYFDGEAIQQIDKKDCQFAYRSSIFQSQSKWVIPEALFDLPFQPQEVGEKKRKQRLEWSAQNQDIRYPNAGSIFRQGHGRVFNWLKGLRWGKAGWSSKTGNWINNYGQASSQEVMWLIRIAIILHYIILKKADLEIIIWK